MVPGGADGWSAAGVDEFLRSYLTPNGRAAFYAAARNIYLEEPHGEKGFWTRLPELAHAVALRLGPPGPGRPDRASPQHVREALPKARHLELTAATCRSSSAPRRRTRRSCASCGG